MKRPVFASILCAVMLAGAPLASPAAAQTLGQGVGAPLAGILGTASDNALDQLAQPGAFYADEAVRILLPGPLRNLSGALKLADRAGLTNNLTKSLNDAAGLAAKEAKPIFRNSIENITLKDGVGIASKNDGATRYLQESAGDELHTRVRPLIADALGETGAFEQMDKLTTGSSLLGNVGLGRDSLIDSVTEQALSGIFTYMGAEEAKLRANPLDTGRKLLQGLGR